MALDIEEQHQIEQVKKWLQEYGLTLVVTIILAAALMFGYQRWSQSREVTMAEASVLYEQLLDHLAQNQQSAANTSADTLIKNYPRSTYAKLAELLVAKNDIQQNNFDDAKVQLNDVIHHGSVPSLKQIARLRLARLQVQLNQPEDALNTLADIDAKEYLPVIASVRGDAYTALKNIPMARNAYTQALAGIPTNAILHSIVTMKLNNLPAS